MASPTSLLPVNVIIAISGLSTIVRPTTEPGPVTTLYAPLGAPASSITRANRSALSGVALAGLCTMALPAASAGPTLCMARLNGTLNGVIAPITPSGSRTVRAMRPLPMGAPSIGTTSPWRRRASSVEAIRVCSVRSASPRASLMGLPVSQQITRAKSARSRRTIAVIFSSKSARSKLLSHRIRLAPSRALSMARATRAASAA